MASLIEELTSTLNEELESYQRLLELSEKKTEILVNGHVPALQEITKEEQELAGRVFRLDKKRENVLKDICLVINKKSEDITLSTLIDLLGNQVNEREQLTEIDQALKETLEKLRFKNEQNKLLLNQSLDLVNFTINAIRSIQEYPQTASYENKGNTSNSTGRNSMFDAKQ
jgi:flagellar biosynthesis/type III secretory pathway chaperone